MGRLPPVLAVLLHRTVTGQVAKRRLQHRADAVLRAAYRRGALSRGGDRLPGRG
ncbi:hypothetical protein LV779_39095 [Streptomyces thinghirensis]|nr:hypothetical protein [Streptomyces thinghirensis]